MNRDILLEDLPEKRILFGMFFAFGNRLQAAGDTFYDEITCKQFFLLICLSLFTDQDPSINELSDVMGSSHQNVKQMINKLTEKGFVKTYSDSQDKRKLRIQKTAKMAEMKHQYHSQEMLFMENLYQGLSQEQIIITLQTIQHMEKNLINIQGRQ